jgi:hypothetical protein
MLIRNQGEAFVRTRQEISCQVQSTIKSCCLFKQTCEVCQILLGTGENQHDSSILPVW